VGVLRSAAHRRVESRLRVWLFGARFHHRPPPYTARAFVFWVWGPSMAVL
jgi:hypothetical protein